MEPITIFHCKTNKITKALTYAVLEWALMFFLLLNSLFSCLIIKFARYFRLKPPCILCSRLDHIFDPTNFDSSYRNLICQQHSIEFSKSGYCFNHRKLVESQDLCENCSSKHPDLSSVVSPLICCCCGVTVKSENLPTHDEIEPCLGVWGDTQMENLLSREGYLSNFGLVGGSGYDLKREGFSLVEDEGNVVLEAKREPGLKGSNSAIRSAYENDIIIPHHLEFYIDNDDYGLIPVDLLNLGQEKGTQLWRETDDELVFEPDFALSPAGINGEQNSNFSCLDFMKIDELKVEDLPNKEAPEGKGILSLLDKAKIENLVSKQGQVDEEVDADVEKHGTELAKFRPIQDQEEETNTEVYLAYGDQEPYVSLTVSDNQVTKGRELNEVDIKILSIDSEDIPCKESNEVGLENDEIQVTESSASCKDEGPSSVICEVFTSTSNLLENGHHDSGDVCHRENDKIDIENDKVQENGHYDEGENEKEIEIDDSLQHLHRKLLLLGNEESLDGSVVNDVECGYGEVTIEELKSELRGKRKALRALYEELEEERNAAAIAASQTMAMINRLQEEKAAIEMEALQYQRMMEEQAEYDQEALQVMNEILVKREREKEDLEKELEMFRKNECKENGHHDTHTDAILNVKDALSCFEEERISILEQLKVLDENLCALAEEEERQIRSMDPFDEFNEDNGEELRSIKVNGDHKNGFDDELLDEDDGRMDPFLLDGLPLTRFESEKRRFTIEEEVERLYERLQALEADKEFIKHCFTSLRKGDRGIDLLQEILQHLRDLKSVEFRRRSVDGVF